MQCQMAFEDLKEVISTKPVMRFPDLDLPFEVQTDASDRALGGLLVQEGHFMALKALLIGKHFTVVTDNVVNIFFKTQKKLNPRQARWKKVITYIMTLSEVISNFNEKIKQAAEQDAAYGRLNLSDGQDQEEEGYRVAAAPPHSNRPWESISMDFITGFPKVRDFKSIFVVVDRFSKYVVFIPASDACPEEKAAKPIWVELFKLLGSELKFSTANHPQTDGQTERINALLKEYLMHYVTATQKNWVDLLDTAQLCYNLQRSSTTGMSPFELAIGEMFDKAWDSLEKTAKRMKKYANHDRRPLEFQVGDKVLLKLTPQIWKKISSNTRQRSLIPKYDGPFKFLKPYHEDLDTEKMQTKRAPPLVMKQFDREIEKILDHRTMGHSKKNRRTDFLVQ
ncbi:Transposon Tf2-11 polyprotein [Vitis vinifera]|uniref:Transposon Tf2-11 polyprotein n=1 Tax=Vitis vinifera TaxID=29760 RepID=A0A438FHX0_VITVI|nr:Transposon Tf2-11 polyprotein [Vitis vinifera]